MYGPVSECKWCKKKIRRVRTGRDQWMHVDSKLWYCWLGGHITRSEYAEPKD
jgi:hypothetical protein